jgi:transcriptional regulator with XRE-family HTH domain
LEKSHIEINIKRTLGARIREERQKKGWTIEHLAECMDLSPSFLGSVERSKRALSIEKLYRASEIFSVTTDSLIKSELQYDSRTEAFNLLLKDLSYNEYTTIYEIASTAKRHFKGNEK